MTINIIILIVVLLALLTSIAAFINSQIILRELTEIKVKLGIKVVKRSSFLDKDLDN